MTITRSGRSVRLGLIATLALTTLAACDQAPSEKPHAVYDRYYALIIAGRSFDEDKAFYSKARQAEVMAKVRDQTEKSGRPLKELTDLYLKFTKAIADCGELTLLTEKIDGDRASLVYTRKETCQADQQKDGQELIEMINEDGWKIISNTTKMSG